MKRVLPFAALASLVVLLAIAFRLGAIERAPGPAVAAAPETSPTAPAPLPEPTLRVLPLGSSLDEPPARRAIETDSPEPDQALDGDPEPIHEVRLVDLFGNPLGGLTAADPEGQTFRSDADGLLRFSGPAWSVRRMNFGEWSAVLSGTGRANGHGRGPLLVLAVPASVDIEVVDPDGLPVAGAAVQWSAFGTLRSFPYPVQGVQTIQSSFGSAETNHSGGYRIQGAARGTALHVSARAEGMYAPSRRIEVPSDGPTVLRMQRAVRSESEEVTVRGRVLDEFGSPVEGAHLAFLRPWGGSTESDDNGYFSFLIRARNHMEGDLVLVARHPELGLARYDTLQEELDAARPEAPAEILLRLGGEASRLRGRLLIPRSLPGRGGGADIHSPAGWRVSIVDPTGHPFTADLSAALEGQSLTVETDGEGRFVFPTLDGGRAYLLCAISPCAQVARIAGPFTPGGSEVTVAIDRDGEFPVIEGWIRNPTGLPIEGVKVSARVHSSRIVSRTGSNGSSWDGDSAITDEEGHFRLEGVPREGGFLSVQGVGERVIENKDFPLGDLDPGVELDLRVTRLLPVRFEVGDALPPPGVRDIERVVYVRALDHEGNELSMSWFSGTSRMSSNPVDLRNVHTNHVYVSERAVAAELIRLDQRRERIVLQRSLVDLSAADHEVPTTIWLLPE